MSERKDIVRFQAQRLEQSGNLLKSIQDDDCISIVYGEGGGCTLHVVGGAAGFWAPIRGAVRVNSTNLNQTVHAKQALITEYDTGIKAIGHANTRWLAVLGSKRAWATLLANAQGHDTQFLLDYQQLLSEFHPISRDFRRKVIAVARSASSLELERAMHAIADEIAAGQEILQAAIGRCPGRTYAKRRQAFLRLQRVRNFMSAHCDEELDNELLARRAHYSPCHFIRIFNSVFLQTPHAYLVQERLLRAQRLLQSGNLAVLEVAHASGFESPSAFSRVFRQRFGTTAKETLRRGSSGFHF